MEIRKATIKDLQDIVEIHCDAFKSFFLTSLGIDFLKFYYDCLIKNSEALVMVADLNGSICGFSASTKKSKGFNTRLIKSNLFSFGLLFIKLLVTSPKSLIRLLKNLTKKSDTVKDEEDYAELYSIGVSSVVQGKGVGKKLLKATELEMQVSKVNKLSLTTDYENNESTLGFYRSMGYDTLYVFSTYPSRKMYRLIKTL